MCTNEHNLVSLHHVSEEIGLYFVSGWIQAVSSYSFFLSNGKSFPMIPLLKKSRAFSWGCSLVSDYCNGYSYIISIDITSRPPLQKIRTNTRTQVSYVAFESDCKIRGRNSQIVKYLLLSLHCHKCIRTYWWEGGAICLRICYLWVCVICTSLLP